MIKTILFVLSFIFLIAFVGLAIWQGYVFATSAGDSGEKAIRRKYQQELDSHSSWDSNYNAISQELAVKMKKELADYRKTHKIRRKGAVGFFTFLPLAISTLAFTIIVPESFHQVETGTVAIVRELGKIVDVREPGTYFDFYMIRNYEVFDTRVQQDHIVTSAYSKDGQTMDLEVFLQYRVQTNHIMEIATQYGNLNALQSRIETQAIEKTKAVMSSAEAMTIIQNRAQFSNDVSTAVREGISDDYYVDIKDVVLTNIDFTDEFEKSVEDKVIAEQEKQAAITRAEAELEVAKLEAQKKIEEAKGNAEAQKIVAQAAAEAATYNIVELARTIGYDVSEDYLYSVTNRDAEGNITSIVEQSFTSKQPETEDFVYLGVKYTIDITSGPGAEKFKTLVEDYLAYLAYLEEWNGELPDVVAGNDAISIIVPNGN